MFNVRIINASSRLEYYIKNALNNTVTEACPSKTTTFIFIDVSIIFYGNGF